MTYIDVRGAKSDSDYTVNFVDRNIYLADSEGQEEKIRSYSHYFWYLVKEFSGTKDIAKLMLNKAKEEYQKGLEVRRKHHPLMG
jgi:hypothetical protein